MITRLFTWKSIRFPIYLINWIERLFGKKTTSPCLGDALCNPLCVLLDLFRFINLLFKLLFRCYLPSIDYVHFLHLKKPARNYLLFCVCVLRTNVLVLLILGALYCSWREQRLVVSLFRAFWRFFQDCFSAFMVILYWVML